MWRNPRRLSLPMKHYAKFGRLLSKLATAQTALASAFTIAKEINTDLEKETTLSRIVADLGSKQSTSRKGQRAVKRNQQRRKK